MTTWFTSDLHFGHEFMTTLRPWDNVDAMNQGLINNWNEVVGNGDTVYVLGDIVMGRFAHTLNCVLALKGNKRLLPGNHDRMHPGYKSKTPDRFRQMYEDVGLEIIEDFIFPNITSNDRSMIVDLQFSHFPYEDVARHDDRWTDYLPVKPVGRVNPVWLLHGHTHSAERINVAQQSVHIGTDAWDFTPVSLETVMALIQNPGGN